MHVYMLNLNIDSMYFCCLYRCAMEFFCFVCMYMYIYIRMMMIIFVPYFLLLITAKQCLWIWWCCTMTNWWNKGPCSIFFVFFSLDISFDKNSIHIYLFIRVIYTFIIYIFLHISHSSFHTAEKCICLLYYYRVLV